MTVCGGGGALMTSFNSFGAVFYDLKTSSINKGIMHNASGSSLSYIVVSITICTVCTSIHDVFNLDDGCVFCCDNEIE